MAVHSARDALNHADLDRAATIKALADTAGALLAFLNLPAGASGTTTTDSQTRFLGAVRAGHAEATSRVLHKGRTLIVVDTEVRDPGGRLVARTSQAQLVLSK